MVNEIIREVEVCLNNGCCIAGLSLALTLPDICGKALYPDLEYKTRDRYIKWFAPAISDIIGTDTIWGFLTVGAAVCFAAGILFRSGLGRSS